MRSESLAEKALMLFCQKSEKAHKLFGQELLNQRMGLKKSDKAIEQYLLRWNDTIRQGIVSIAVQAVGGSSEKALPLQVALSFIDATMDIHDDIIDDSVTKKKTKTLYGKLGKGSALLIGDDLMVKGFHHLHQAIAILPKDKQLQIMDIINGFLGEVVRAHIAETELKQIKWDVKPQTYLNILRQKAAEIEGRMRIAAIYGGGTDEEIKALSKYGRNLGIFLAVRAEYTDLFEPNELSNRSKFECLPLYMIYAFQKATAKKEINLLLSKPTLTKRDTNRILEVLIETGAIQDVNIQLRSLQEEALDILQVIRNKEEKKHLELIIKALMEDM